VRPRHANIALVLLFAILLVAPTVVTTFHIEPFASLSEKRPPARRPSQLLGSAPGPVTAASLLAAAQEWDRYYTDNFGLRKFLAGSYRAFAVHVLNTSLFPAVVIGQVHNGVQWYYYNGSANDDGAGFESLLGKNPYTPEELALTAENVRKTQELLRRNGIRFVLLVVPDKQTVYPEYLPPRFHPPQGARSRLDQFWTATHAGESQGLIDLRDALLRAKGEPLYFPSDTHWTEFAAFQGYQAVINAFRAQDGGPPALARSDVAFIPSGGPPVVGDCAGLMGLPVRRGESLYKLILPGRAAFGRPRGKKLLVLSDSFSIALDPYFRFEFEEVVVVASIKRGARQMHVTQELLDTHKPSAVLLESVERYWTM